MPRKIVYPRPWVPNGNGSYREYREGVFEVTWRPLGHAGPKRKKKITCTEKEAVAYLDAREAERSRAAAGLPVMLTWADAIERYTERLNARGNNEGYKSDVLALLKDVRDSVRVDPPDVQPIHIDKWLQDVAEAMKNFNYPGWASSCNKKRRMVSAFFRFLARRRLILFNPVESNDPFRETIKAPRNVKPAEYVAVWGKCEESLRDLLDFLLLTGVRFGEAARMKRSDVTGALWLIQKRKGKNDLKMPLPPLLLEIVLRQPLMPDNLVWHKWVKPKPWLEKGGRNVELGSPIESPWLCDVLKQRCKAADVEYFHAHDLRHAAGSWANEEGMATSSIQMLLGHTQISTTERYAHGDGTKGAERVQKLLQTIRETALKAMEGQALKG